MTAYEAGGTQYNGWEARDDRAGMRPDEVERELRHHYIRLVNYLEWWLAGEPEPEAARETDDELEYERQRHARDAIQAPTGERQKHRDLAFICEREQMRRLRAGLS